MTFKELKKKVITPGLCTHCGTCAGLIPGISLKETRRGPLPFSNEEKLEISDEVWEACPGKGINYASLNNSVFGELPKQWLIGHVAKTFIGHSANEEIRLKGASGGVITQILLYLLEKNLIQGAILLNHGVPKPWLAQSIIATTAEQVIAGAQSVYAPIPVNTILSESQKFEGTLAYVGLPDQVISIRKLQELKHQAVQNIKYILGPYVGINMYAGSVLRFARSSGIKKADAIKEVKYRDGEWPGYLRITTHAGQTVKAEKFYYNYLLPFYITRSTLLSVDFANDLTDISVGDAWHPTYEKEGKGFAAIVGRNRRGTELLESMQTEGYLTLQEKTSEELLNMHGHMFDFKKRGAFVRMQFRKLTGRKIPDYGIWPEKLGFSRYFVEIIISGVIFLCSNAIARVLLGLIPISIIGRFFNASRKGWKNVSKPTKRKGLLNQEYIIR